ncbi:hypothetical protein [Chloroflexus sp.]|uniref:hypothetical protein n=1 Tax=Chloroflexus sp. TaxID=1904827 RepID=UPI002ADDEB15|nr:hypothetical protein [Chloroflexus sp.]
MSDNDSVHYNCPKCGYTNIWTRDELLQKGQKIIYRQETVDTLEFSVRCKNRDCDHRMRIRVPKK